MVSAVVEARAVLEPRHFPFPYSLDTMAPEFKSGLIPVGLFALMSLISVSGLLVFITHRLVAWRKYGKTYVGYNQYVILIYNLLLADLQQSIAFCISFHWIRLGEIPAPSAPCFVQAWFLQIGDVSSGFFVLAIAIHTWMGVVKGYRMPYRWFVVAILFIWALSLLLTIIGPAMYGGRFFTRAGGWCWISPDYKDERLYLHYLWIFIVEFGTVLIYAHIFVHLRGRLDTIMSNDTSKLSRATKFMIMYPTAYVILTLPLAIGRMVSMRGVNMPDKFYFIAGSFLTSCGWVDALLYTLTRRVLVGGDVSNHQYNRTVSTPAHTDATKKSEAYGMLSMNKDHTVTIVGGDRRSRTDHQRSGRKPTRPSPDTLLEHSRTGSEDSIVKPGPNAIGVVTDTTIEVDSMTRNSECSDIPSSNGSGPAKLLDRSAK